MRRSVSVTDPPILAEVDANSEEDTLFSRVALSANPRKSDYLGNRACGFSVREACNLAGVTMRTLIGWRKKDKEFREFESNNLYELQKSIGPDMARLWFLRNYVLLLKIDNKVLNVAALTGVNPQEIVDLTDSTRARSGLTTREFEYLKIAQGRYRSAELLALHRALIPEQEGGDGSAIGPLVVILDGQVLQGEAASRAAARALLNQFTVNAKMLPEGQEDGNGDQSGSD
jgi:hypothetical protein